MIILYILAGIFVGIFFGIRMAAWEQREYENSVKKAKEEINKHFGDHN